MLNENSILHMFCMTAGLTFPDYSELFGFGQAEGIKTQMHFFVDL